jgi:hypothetical protein
LMDKAAFERCGEKGGTRCRHGFVIYHRRAFRATTLPAGC